MKTAVRRSSLAGAALTRTKRKNNPVPDAVDLEFLLMPPFDRSTLTSADRRSVERLPEIPIRLRPLHSKVTARALGVLGQTIGPGAERTDAARLLYSALYSLNTEHDGSSASARQLRREFRADAVKVQRLARTVCDLLGREGDFPSWTMLSFGFSNVTAGRVVRAAIELESASAEFVAELTDRRGAPSRSWMLWDSVDATLLRNGFTAGDLADLVLESAQDWEPAPCPEYVKAKFNIRFGQRAARKQLLDDLLKMRRRGRASLWPR